MFRHKGRLLMTQLVLIAAGSTFMMVMSLNSSLALTLDNFSKRQDYEMTLQFDNNERVDLVDSLATSVEGVEEDELWLVQSASMFVEGQLVSEAGVGTNIKGAPENSEFYKSLELKDSFESKNMKIVDSQTQAALRTTNEWQFSIVTSKLLALSVIVAIVGGIALMGALSIGIIERTKEIGVLRAIGARSPMILGIFVMEGIFQGGLSWLISIPISLIASPPVASTLGHAMFGATLDYQYNWAAVAIWLGIILFISVLASVLPARGAIRISVRDSLAYA